MLKFLLYSLSTIELQLCPTVLSVKDEDRLISVGTETSIRLNTLNIPDENYPKCVVEFSPSQKTEVSAV